MSTKEWRDSWAKVKKLVCGGQTEDALRILRAMLDNAMTSGSSPIQVVRCHEMITWLHLRQERYDEARIHFQQADKIISDADLTLTPIDTYNHELNRALLEMQYSSLEKAAHSLQLCTTIARSIKKPILKMRALRYRCVVELLRGDTINAINAANEIEKLAKLSNTPLIEELVVAHLVKSYLYRSKGDAEGYHHSLKNAMRLLAQVEDMNLFLSLVKTSMYLFVWGDKTINDITEIISLLNERGLGDVQIGSDFCLLIAYYYLKQGNIEQFRHWMDLSERFDSQFLTSYQQSLKSFFQGYITLLDEFSETDRLMRMKKAIKHLTVSRQLALDLGFTFHQVLTGLGLASVHLEMNEVSTAIKMVQEVMEIARQRQWWPLALKSETLLIELLALNGQFSEAEKRLRKLRVLLPFKPQLMKFVDLNSLQTTVEMTSRLDAVDQSLQQSAHVAREIKVTEIQQYIQECMSMLVE